MMGRPTNLAVILLLVCAGCMAHEPAPGRADPARDWIMADAGAAGFNSETLDRLAAEIGAGGFPNTHALLIEHDGRLIYERYFSGSDERWGEAIPARSMGADSLHDVRSVSKSVTSALLGIALGDDFEAALAHPIGHYLSGLELGPAHRAITLQHVLTMTPGLEWNEMTVPYTDRTNDEIRLYRAGDPARHVMSRPVVHEPGSTWYYSGGTTQLLASVITELTGQRLDDFARDHLFGPLGITDFEWLGPGEWTPDNPAAMSGLRLAARDLAKIGSVYLNGGRWQGRQVVPEAWVSRSSLRHIDDTGDWGDDGMWGYGYQWWIGDLPAGPRVVAAFGNGDQCLQVIPEERLVVTVLGGRYNQPPALCQEILERVLAARADYGGRGSVRAAPNDQRSPAGRLVDGTLHVELEAVEAQWYPRGEDGPRIVTPVFAEVGTTPSVPGPLIRVTAGTPVVVTVHNRLPRAIEVRGLADRAAEASVPAGMPAGFPPFLFDEPLVVPSGESGVARFTPSAAVSSFYFARVARADGPPLTGFMPGGLADEGAFMGALVVDDAAAPPHSDERVFVITRWGSPGEPGSLDPSWKMMINGQSWPHTEPIELVVGDTAHWRVINTSPVDHPMHLHGFYFVVDGAGDTHTDRLFAAEERREVVTEMMREFSSLRMRWVPERPGNWLFHCHLIRHSGELQRFEADRARAATGAADKRVVPAAGAHDHGGGPSAMDMDGMAGMILGITVHADGAEPDDPEPLRRIDLWTGSRPDVLDGAPELGFVIQNGAQPPAPDSTVVPGSPLVLTRDEPTEIVVHNRLDFALSVHWHGLELRSLYDGVGHWSGYPGSVRPPIPPGDSQRVVLAPPRAGTFFYHTHGEPGHELAQGLYGAFLVMEPGEPWDRDADRVFVLASRGADIDAPPAVNGSVAPPPERFESGRSYRVRFIHISPDEFKRVRLLRDGEPVIWRSRAKDGADLPPTHRVDRPAEVGIGVGEAYDFDWVPETEGVYVLEVRTDYYPNRGGTAVQRIAFGVGDVDDAALRRATQGDASGVTLTPGQRARHTGTFTGRLLPVDDPREWIMAVWEEDGRLYSSIAPRGEVDPEPPYLSPLGDDAFVPGTWTDGMVTRVRDDVRIRFAGSAGAGSRSDVVEVEQGGVTAFRFERTDPFVLRSDELRVFEGTYGGDFIPFDSEVTADDGGLRIDAPGQPPMRLRPISFNRFRIEGGDAPPGAAVIFELQERRASALIWTAPGQSPIRVERR
jgi:manganese oxidase